MDAQMGSNVGRAYFISAPEKKNMRNNRIVPQFHLLHITNAMHGRLARDSAKKKKGRRIRLETSKPTN